jgi:NADH-quinone oxidoreductase subunit J
MTDAKFILFVFTTILALAGALGTIASGRPLRAAMSLLVTIISLAGLYLTLHAQLLAAIQVLVYAGAIVVLFVFVIMLLGPSATTEASPGTLMVRMLSLVGMGMFTSTIAFSFVGVASEWIALPETFGTVEGVGLELYTKALVPFEIVSFTLTTAVVGAVAIARTKSAREIAVAKERSASEAAAVAQPAE